MYQDGKIWIAQSDQNLYLYPAMANRHGLIAGATGTGKTITLKVLAESFSDMGVPVFFADVKGDLSGMCQPGTDSADMQERITRFGIENFTFKNYPTRFWDIFGEKGHPVRVTISDMGPILLAKLFGLTDVQAGVLNIVFKVADDHGLLLLDLKDLRAMLQYVGDNRAEFTTTYGNVSSASIGAIQRALLAFEDQGGELFFGEPALDIRDWMRTDLDGRGFINVLSSTQLIQNPTIYSTFLLWMMTELFEKLPEIGDPEKPRMVFFFDEAHLLFNDTPKALLQKITQVVKLIRSKGVGIYFISQSPSDIPDEVLAQLSNRIQHALRAYTPAEQKAVRAAATAFRENPAFKTEEVLMQLGVGEALVSCLDQAGIPTVVERAFILPPQSRMGAADAEVMQSNILSDEFELKYREMVDRESAYELIMEATKQLEEQRALEEAEEQRQKEEAEAEKLRAKEEAAAEKQRIREEAEAEKQRAREEAAAEKQRIREEAAAEKQRAKEEAAAEKQRLKEEKEKREVWERAGKNAANSVARSVSNNLLSSVLGGKKTSTSTIAKRAASTALNSVVRSGTNSIMRGIFGNKK